MDTLSHTIEGAEQINPTTVQLIFTDKYRLIIDFYGVNIFRVFEDPSGGIVRDPESKPPDPLIPLDEVIETIHTIGMSLPDQFKCTNIGGLCATKTAKILETKLNAGQ